MKKLLAIITIAASLAVSSGAVQAQEQTSADQGALVGIGIVGWKALGVTPQGAVALALLGIAGLTTSDVGAPAAYLNKPDVKVRMKHSTNYTMVDPWDYHLNKAKYDAR